MKQLERVWVWPMEIRLHIFECSIGSDPWHWWLSQRTMGLRLSLLRLGVEWVKFCSALEMVGGHKDKELESIWHDSEEK